MPNVENLVAIRKTPRSETLAVDAASTEEKRSRAVDEAQHSNRVDRLKDIGLDFVPSNEITQHQALIEKEDAFTRLGYIGAYVINSPDEKTTERAKAVLGSEYLIFPNVLLSLPQPPTRAATEVSTRRKHDIQWSAITGIPEARQQGITGKGVRVGVLDTGCDSDHTEFKDRVIDFLYVNPTDPRKTVSRRALDTDTHGTHVCGIIAGQEVGIAPEVELMVASVIESERAETSLDRIMVALDWMLSKFRDTRNLNMPTIINLSLGFRLEALPQKMQIGVKQGLRLILTTLMEDFDVLPVVAIGNDGENMVRVPGSFPECLAVGAVDHAFAAAKFSGSGKAMYSRGKTKPDVAGLGVDIYSALDRDTHNHSRYGLKSGTSMATPYVTGIAALYASADNMLQGKTLRRKILETALKLEAPSERVGAGLARYIGDGSPDR